MDIGPTQCLYLVLVQGEWVMPLYEVPKGHPFIITLCAIRPTILVFVYFYHIYTPLFAGEWHVDAATENERATQVLANASVFVEPKVLWELDLQNTTGAQEAGKPGRLLQRRAKKKVREGTVTGF
jgi:hypothetical protein